MRVCVSPVLSTRSCLPAQHAHMQSTLPACLPACRAIGAEVLIDDNPGYAQECAEAGIHVLLYDWQHGYPWSKTPGGGPTHDRITRWVHGCAVHAVAVRCALCTAGCSRVCITRCVDGCAGFECSEPLSAGAAAAAGCGTGRRWSRCSACWRHSSRGWPSCHC